MFNLVLNLWYLSGSLQILSTSSSGIFGTIRGPDVVPKKMVLWYMFDLALTPPSEACPRPPTIFSLARKFFALFSLAISEEPLRLSLWNRLRSRPLAARSEFDVLTHWNTRGSAGTGDWSLELQIKSNESLHFLFRILDLFLKKLTLRKFDGKFFCFVFASSYRFLSKTAIQFSTSGPSLSLKKPL